MCFYDLDLLEINRFDVCKIKPGYTRETPLLPLHFTACFLLILALLVSLFILGPGDRSGMEDSSVLMGKATPVLESGEAGPPGTKLSSHPPQGSNGSKTPVKGYASAPGKLLLLSLLWLS